MPRVSIIINRPSDSARALARSLDVKRVRPERLGALRPGVLINWGVSYVASYVSRNRGVHHTCLNDWPNVKQAINKLTCFDVLHSHEVQTPLFTTEKESINWDGITFARTTLTGSGGEGIVVVRPGEELPEAPLYTQYIRKSAEYRVHVVRGEAVCVQQKRKQEGAEQSRDTALIRNVANGWIFAVNNVEFANEDVKRQVVEEAIKAVSALGLDFGAVDVIVNLQGTKAYVLEVNTAPGLSSPTVIEAYRSAFTRIITNGG